MCYEVLDTVEKAATDRNAGVIFLGDFWHERGSLPVGPLNGVIELIRRWRFHMLLLVGNHDQVDAAGHVHSLTVLEALSTKFKVISEPTVFLDALWLPYRSNHQELVDAVEATPEESISALFAHVDIVGAMMNEQFLARDGLKPQLFPPSLPVYTGHYHKPHVVPGTRIRYVGSPYQISKAESGQGKRLLVLDSEAGWKVAEEIELDIGPRHFTARGLSECEQLMQATRPGDVARIELTDDDPEASTGAADALQRFRSLGVQVEVVPTPAMAAPRIEGVEELDTRALLATYADATGMDAAACEHALSILNAVDGSQGRGHVSIEFEEVELDGYGPFRDTVRYPLDRRRLRVVTGRNADDSSADSNGAGKSALVMAPLWALTGDTCHGGVRLARSGMVHDRRDEARVAVRGTLNGTPFEVERCVHRSAGGRTARRGRRGGDLLLQLGGQDLTGADMRLTQAAVDGLFNAPLLPRAIFHTQLASLYLLDATDAAFKDALGQVVDLGVWQRAEAAAKESVRAAKKQLGELRLECEAKKGFWSGCLEAAHELQLQASMWEDEQQMQLAQLREQLVQVRMEVAAWMERLQDQTDELISWRIDQAFEEPQERNTVAAAAAAAAAAAEAASTGVQADAAAIAAASGGCAAAEPGVAEGRAERREGEEDAALLAEVRSRLGEVEGRIREVEERQQGRMAAWHFCRERASGLLGGLLHMQQQLQEYESLVQGSDALGEHGLDAMELPDADLLCDRCHQPISVQLYKQNVAAMRERVMERKEDVMAAEGVAEDTLAELEAVEGEKAELQQELDALRADEDALLASRERKLEEERRRRQQEAVRWRVQQQQLEEALQQQRLREQQQRERQEAAWQMRFDVMTLTRQAQDSLRSAAAHLQDCEQLVPPAPEGAAVASLPPLPRLQGEDAADIPEAAVQDRMEQLRNGLQQELHVRLERLAALSSGLRDGLRAVNPHAQPAEQQAERARQAEQEVLAAQELQLECETKLAAAQRAEQSFSGAGIQSFLLEAALAELQAYTAENLRVVSPSFSLSFQPTNSQGKVASTIERITKTIRHCGPEGNVFERSPQQLSSGERSRMAVALCLGFARLLHHRNRLSSNLVVLDEVLANLDKRGCELIVSLLRHCDYSSGLVVGQADSFVANAFDAVDVVVKENGVSRVELGA